MSAGKKDTMQIAIIIVGGLFLLYRFAMPYLSSGGKASISGNIDAELGVDTGQLKEAISVSECPDPEESAPDKGSVVKDILQRPRELIALETKESSGPVTVSDPVSSEEEVLVLEGVMVSREKNIAIISHKVVVEGDMIGDVKIVKIRQSGVTIL